LKGQIEGTEHIHSVLDRKAESNTVETVLCILEDFIADKVITDNSVTGCRAGLNTTFLNVDVKESEVQSHLAVGDDDNYSVTCVAGESHFFTPAGNLVAPDVAEPYPDGYVPHEISAENTTIASYTEQAVWEQIINLSSGFSTARLGACGVQ